MNLDFNRKQIDWLLAAAKTRLEVRPDPLGKKVFALLSEYRSVSGAANDRAKTPGEGAFSVSTPSGILLFTGSLASVSSILRLRREAEQRILRETPNGGSCELFITRGTPFKTLSFVVSRSILR